MTKVYRPKKDVTKVLTNFGGCSRWEGRKLKYFLNLPPGTQYFNLLAFSMLCQIWLAQGKGVPIIVVTGWRRTRYGSHMTGDRKRPWQILDSAVLESIKFSTEGIMVPNKKKLLAPFVLNIYGVIEVLKLQTNFVNALQLQSAQTGKFQFL